MWNTAALAKSSLPVHPSRLSVANVPNTSWTLTCDNSAWNFVVFGAVISLKQFVILRAVQVSKILVPRPKPGTLIF